MAAVTATLTTLGAGRRAGGRVQPGHVERFVCQIVLANDRATQGTVVIGGVSALRQPLRAHLRRWEYLGSLSAYETHITVSCIPKHELTGSGFGDGSPAV